MHHTTKFSKITLSFIFVSQKFKLKLISEKLLLPVIPRNKVSITVSTLRFNITRERVCIYFIKPYAVINKI